MAALDETPSAKRWLPLEANPEVMNQVFLYIFFFLIKLCLAGKKWIGKDKKILVLQLIRLYGHAKLI